MSTEVKEDTIKPIVVKDFLVKVNNRTNRLLLESDLAVAAAHKKLRMLDNRDFMKIKRAVQARLSQLH